jgi:hypothetical protein
MGLPLIVAMSASAASAQLAVDVPARFDVDEAAPRTTATLQYSHQFKSTIRLKGIQYQRDNASLGIARRYTLGDHTKLVAMGTYTLHAYDFGGQGNPNARYRWDDIHRLVFSGLADHELNAQWHLIGGAFVRSWGEGGAKAKDSISGGLLAGFEYRHSPDLSLGLLLGGQNRLEGGVGLLPIPRVDWRPAESFRVQVGMVQLVDPGLGAQLTYQITPAIELGTGFAYEVRRFRLSDNRDRVTKGGPDHGGRTDNGGVGQESDLPLVATIRWRPIPQAELELNSGAVFNGKLRLEDKKGGRIADNSYHPAAILGLKGRIVF